MACYVCTSLFIFSGFGQDPFPLCHVAHQWEKKRKTNPINITFLVEYFFHEYNYINEDWRDLIMRIYRHAY